MTALDVSLEIGKLQGQLEAVRADNDRMAASLDRIEVDVRTMAATMNQARGGWRVLVAISGSAGGVLGGMIVSAWHWIQSRGAQ